MIINLRPLLKERLSLVSKLNFSRMANYLKILAGYRLSILIKKPIVLGKPFALQVETASLCNLKCPECMAGRGATQRNRKYSDIEFVNGVLDHFREYSFYCNLYFQGEPFLNPNIYELIESARLMRYFSVISTNGHFLSEKSCTRIIESGLDRIIISLDGTDQGSYSKYRINGQFSKVTRGIRTLSEIRKKTGTLHPLIVIQFLVNNSNEHQLKDARILAKQLGADILKFKSMQVYSEEGIKAYIPKNPKYDRYSGLRSKGSRSCFRLWGSMVFTSDGKVVPCCYDKIPEYILGESSVNPITIWQSADYNNLRQSILKGDKRPAICNNCIQ